MIHKLGEREYIVYRGYLYTVGKGTDCVHVTFRIDNTAKHNLIFVILYEHYFQVISFQDDAFDNFAGHEDTSRMTQ